MVFKKCNLKTELKGIENEDQKHCTPQAVKRKMTQEQDTWWVTLNKKMQKLAITWRNTEQKPLTILLGGTADKKGKNKQVKLRQPQKVYQ